MKYYQQGDVLIKPVEQVPHHAEEEPEAILAEGEVTGHHHRALGEGVTLCRYQSELYLAAPRGAEITHPEHRPIRIAAGRYRIDRVREYDHFGEIAQEKPGRPITPAVARARARRQMLASPDHRAIRRVLD